MANIYVEQQLFWIEVVEPDNCVKSRGVMYRCDASEFVNRTLSFHRFHSLFRLGVRDRATDSLQKYFSENQCLALHVGQFHNIRQT